MSILIDVGNTRAKVCVSVGRELFAHKAVCHKDLIDTVNDLVSHHNETELLMASVAAAPLSDELLSFSESKGIKYQEVKTPPHAFGLINAYRQYGNLGVDRWLAMLGARVECRAPLIVIDVGTAITVDLVDEFGQHKGGWITPGLKTMREALFGNTQKVAGPGQSNTPGSDDLSARFGITTADCVSGGLQAVLIGVFQQAKDTARRTLKTNTAPKLFVTGGDATKLPDCLLSESEYRPDLVLQGLNSYRSE
ncbi:type III pantothenate kinase [Corallincola platygyrae]|uniref:Type III pantothenate kinase n=1 Tax=Corallincola platygyrae TaxID=1193278 RepID=A0ABW4XPI6_9GAMM